MNQPNKLLVLRDDTILVCQRSNVSFVSFRLGHRNWRKELSEESLDQPMRGFEPVQQGCIGPRS